MNLRAYTPDDEAALIRLKADTFERGHDRFTQAYWRWQYALNPAGPAAGVVAEDEHGIVGFMGILPRRLKVDDSSILCGLLVDYAIHPRAQGRFVAVRIVQKANALARQSGFTATIGLPNRNSEGLATTPRVGMRPIFTPMYRIRPLRGFQLPSDIPARPLLGFGVSMAAFLTRSLESVVGNRRRAARLQTVPLADVDDSLDQVWASASRQTPVLLVRDADYVRWRYMRHPVYRYDLLAARCGGRTVGWLAMSRREVKGVRLGLMVDWLLDMDTPDVGAWLADAALTWARRSDVDAIAVAGRPRQTGSADLLRNGWISLPARLLPSSPRFMLCPLRVGTEPCEDPTRWFWTWGDSDVA